MAIKQNYITSQGIEINDAYVRVFGIDLVSKTHALIKIGVHVSADKPMIEYRTASFDFDISDNVFVQAYNYLKTLPQFAGAVDC